MDKPYYLAYEDRYRKVYEAGAEFWGQRPDDEELTDVLTEWVQRHNLRGKRIIEFGCGEGASGVILSKLGCLYHGVDISPTVVEKARDTLRECPTARVTQLNMVSGKIDGVYDAALDALVFHMLITDPDRMGYLKNAFLCLKSGAPMLFFREQYDPEAYEGFIGTFGEWLSLTGNDYNVTRQMNFQKDGCEVVIEIPYVPGRSKSQAGYMKELSDAGFVVDAIVEMEPSRKIGDSVSIYVHKP